ncbi:MAG: acetyl-CoA carboxylase biotin carboxyl carrier protein [Planctomycetales bacterium]|nr:acetyl-CoA carboxylase biotin carboxyl carrier protein [Planctomycetales bacterium]
MAGDAPKDTEVFNVERIQSLVELMEDRGLSEIDLRHGDQRIRLRRGISQATVTQSLPPAHYAAPPMAAPVPAPSLPQGEDASSLVEGGRRNDDSASIVLVKSPMVGTFYSRPNPEAEAFVKVGDHVNAEQTICIIEAMKVFNPIQAEVTGKVVAILAKDEEPVDYGKPLFKVDTAG